MSTLKFSVSNAASLLLLVLWCAINTPESCLAEKTYSYSELLQLQHGLERNLVRKSAMLRNRTSHFAPPGGSAIKVDEEGVVYFETDVQVIVSVTRIDVMDVDSQTLKFAAEVGLAWVDTNFNWEYNDTTFPVRSMLVDNDKFWTPNLMPEGIIGYDYIPSGIKPTVTLLNQGFFISKVIATITVPCDVEVLTYPFDTHHCHLNFIQPFNPTARMNYIAVPIEGEGTGDDLYFNTEHKHREWDLIRLKSSSKEDGLIYHMEIVLQRKATFYAIVLILPCIILNLITFLMFVVPTDGTDRIDLALNLILSYFVLLLILIDAIPPSGDAVPLLGLYVVVCTIIVVFIMVSSLILIKFNKMKESGNTEVPLKVFRCFTTKIHVLKCLGGSGNGSRKNSIPDENPKNNNAKDDEEIPLKGALKGEVTASDNDAESRQMDAIIFNLNFILFVITAVIHVLLLIGVSVVWTMKTE